MDKLEWIGGVTALALTFGGCGGSGDPGTESHAIGSATAGKNKFTQEVKHGNGRACATCHPEANSFTLTPQAVEARYQLFQAGNDDPLFRSLDADDFDSDYTTLRQRALIRVTLDLPAGVKLKADPSATTVSVWRAIPAIFNVALSAPYLADGRAADLAAQARGAIQGHMEPSKDPPDSHISMMVAYEQTVFSSPRVGALADALSSGAAPIDPDPPLDGLQTAGKAVFAARCAGCHGGPSGNLHQPAGSRQFFSVDVSDFNEGGLAKQQFQFSCADGSTRVVESPDPGRALITGKCEDINAFKIPQLRGIGRTAPYFHDNSAGTLQDVIDHYNRHFVARGRPAIDNAPALLAYLQAI